MFKNIILIVCVLALNTFVFAEENVQLQENNANPEVAQQVEQVQTADEPTEYTEYSNTEEAAEATEEENIKTRPVTADLDRATAKSPYENDLNSVVSNSEFLFVVFKFLMVMTGVVISCIIVYLLAIFVRRFYAPKENNTQQTSDTKTDDNLKPAQNENDSLKIFLNKTKNP